MPGSYQIHKSHAKDFGRNPAALGHMKPIMEIAKFDARLYEVMETITV